jgi:hypothetical protein
LPFHSTEHIREQGWRNEIHTSGSWDSERGCENVLVSRWS